MLSASAGSLDLERDGATGSYRVLSAVLAAPGGSASQLWGGLSECGGYYELRSASGLALDLANTIAAGRSPRPLQPPIQ